MRKQETGSSRIHEFETVYRDSSRQSAYLAAEKRLLYFTLKRT